MKNNMLSVSLISVLLFLTGIIFKKLHFPGAGILIVLGALIGLIFLAYYLIKGTRFLKNGMEKSNGLIASLAMILVITGFVFKAQHWPGANILLVVSHISILISAVIMFLDAFNESDESKKPVKALFAFIYAILMSILVYLAILFNRFQPPHNG